MSFRMSSPSTSRLSAQMDEVFFLFSLRSKYVASSGRTVSLAVMPASRPPGKVCISCKAEWVLVSFGIGIDSCRGGHSRESGNPVRRQHISKGLRSRFPLSRE